MILLGIRDRTGDLIGVGADIAGLKDQVTNMIRSTIYPEPRVRLVEGIIKHRTILAIYVEQGDQPPYGLPHDEKRIRYYVRRGANSFAARPEDIRAIFQARQALNQGPYSKF